ncbi:MAG: GpE family phage tail protein [Sphingobium sp.]
MIADIAFIFHWPLPDLLAMELDELTHWQGLAVNRWKTVNSPGKS